MPAAGLIILIFAVSYFYARRIGPVDVSAANDEASDLFQETADAGPLDHERA